MSGESSIGYFLFNFTQSRAKVTLNSSSPLLPRKLPHKVMAEVPRHSTFPPILQDYLPGVKSQAKPLEPATQGEATGVTRLLEGKEAVKTGKTIRARVRVKDGEATAKLQSVSENFKKEERERRQKRGKVLFSLIP